MYFYLLCNYRTKLCLNGNKSAESNSILKINNIVLISPSFYDIFCRLSLKQTCCLTMNLREVGFSFPRMMNLEYCNAQNTALWELHALRVRGPPTPALSYFSVFSQVAIIARESCILFWDYLRTIPVLIFHISLCSCY